MILEKIRSHNYINGFKFSAIEFLLAALVIAPFFIYYLGHSKWLQALFSGGLILNFLTITFFAYSSLLKKEISIGWRFYLDSNLRKSIGKEYSHLTKDTLVLCIVMLIPFALFSISLGESIYATTGDSYKASLPFLLWITILNYLAQIPYYLRNYYFPYHAAPNVRGVILLSATLLWFLVGYVGFQKNKKWGTYVLLSFLIIEALFYLISVLSGAFLFQMGNPSLIIRSVFIIGYLSGAVSAYYTCAILAREYRLKYRL
jgi:hypothetical protein